MPDDPRFIPGIYQYCDRWCERCGFSMRCLNFALEQRAQQKEGAGPADKRSMWQSLQDLFEQAHETLTDLARERGIEPDAETTRQIAERRLTGAAAARHHPLAVAARGYTRMVDAWFEAEQKFFAQQTQEWQAMAEQGIGLREVQSQCLEFKNLVDVIRWYQSFIYVKLARALKQRPPAALPPAEIQTDANGSAKIALIAMDRSIAAWIRMRTLFREKTDPILNLLVHLDRIRRQTESSFPLARRFLRPGFDTTKKGE